METMLRTSNASIDQLLTVERILRDAVEDDPSFAAAALWLAQANRGIQIQSQGGVGPLNFQSDRGADILRFTERAFQLADTATPLERLNITGHFRHTRAGATEDPEKVAQAASGRRCCPRCSPMTRPSGRCCRTAIGCWVGRATRPHWIYVWLTRGLGTWA